MKTGLILAALLAAHSSFAANFGAPAALTKTATTTTAATPAATLVVSTGPQIAGAFRIVKPDGNTVIQQGTLSTSSGSIQVINLADTDAFLKSGGKCAFNVKYDEVSAMAATNTTNRLYSNDKLIAQNTKIDLAAGVPKTIWTQPYLVAGMNNVRVVVNADSATPSTGWIRINVSGTCGGTNATETPPATAVTPTTPEKPKTTEPPKTSTEINKPTTTTPAPTVKILPGSAEWNNLNNAFGYSNYGVTQLKGKGYARYDELVKLNAALTTVINAKSAEQGAYNSLMTSWNTFVTDPAFKAAMAAIVPGTSDKK